MRLCAGLPCTLCLNPDVKPNAPLRRSPLHPVPLNPDVTRICAPAPVSPAPRASSSTTTDMRLCAGQPCTSCLILNNKRYAPLRRSTLHLVPHPQQQPICALRRSPLHLVPHPQQQPICAPAPVNPAPRVSSSTTTDMRPAPVNPAPRVSSSTTTDMRLCAGQPCTSCLNPHQQPICAPAPVNPAPRASSSTTTDMRLCAGQPCTSCLILNNNRYAPLRRSTLHLVPHPQQQPICALRRSTLHLVPHPQQQPICALRRSTLLLVARPCTIQSNINPSINPLPGRGRWGSDSEAERGRMAWRQEVSERERSLSDWPSGHKAIYPRI